jgi:hypothetical protein
MESQKFKHSEGLINIYVYIDYFLFKVIVSRADVNDNKVTEKNKILYHRYCEFGAADLTMSGID